MKKVLVAVSILLLTAGLIACTDEAADDPVTPVPTPLPTTAPATPVPAPTAEPAPTSTPSPPAPAPTSAPAPTVAPPPTPSAPPKPTINDILDHAVNAVVQVESSGGRGSGTIFDALGYVLTAEHVVGAEYPKHRLDPAF